MFGENISQNGACMKNEICYCIGSGTHGQLSKKFSYSKVFILMF